MTGERGRLLSCGHPAATPDAMSFLLATSAALALSISVPQEATDEPAAEPAPLPAVQVPVEGGTLHVRDLAPEAGSDEPAILLLTGGPGFSGALFEPLAQHLAARHRVLLPDQRGTGKSVMEPWDPAPFTIEGAVADLETIREALGLERWILLGHSWGGILGMSYAAEHPERVAGLVLVDSGGVSPEPANRSRVS